MKFNLLKPFGLLITASPPCSITELDPFLIQKKMEEHSLVLLRNFTSPSRDQFLQYCESFPNSHLLQWEFGPVMEMKEDPTSKNYLFSNEKVPFHWDGAFYKTPRILAFHCIEAPPTETGGETLFSQTEFIIKNSNKTERSEWKNIELTYETEKMAHYGGKIRTSLLQPHPSYPERQILRFAEPVDTELNPVSLKINGAKNTPSFIKMITEKIYEKQNCFSHQWRQNDILFADNHSLIHGRNAFTKGKRRHLRRIQIV